MFDIPLLINLFIYLIELKEHPFKTSNKRRHISLLINLFFSLIELKTSIRKYMCKFKIDKMSYSKS